MCRREEWDREYEQNTPRDEEQKEEMKRLKREEDRLRARWDADFHKLQIADEPAVDEPAPGAKSQTAKAETQKTPFSMKGMVLKLF